MLLILFLVSSGILIIGGMWIALSTVCLTYTGTLMTIILLTISGITGNYLYEKIQ